MKVRSNQTMGHKIDRMRASGENRLFGSTHNGKLGALSWNLKLGGSPCSLAITEAWSVCWPDPDPCEDCDVVCAPWWANCNLTGRMVKPERIREYNPHSRSSKIFGEDFSFLPLFISRCRLQALERKRAICPGRGEIAPPSLPNRANEAVSGRWELGIADSKRENEKYALTLSLCTTLVC